MPGSCVRFPEADVDVELGRDMGSRVAGGGRIWGPSSIVGCGICAKLIGLLGSGWMTVPCVGGVLSREFAIVVSVERGQDNVDESQGNRRRDWSWLKVVKDLKARSPCWKVVCRDGRFVKCAVLSMIVLDKKGDGDGA